MSLMNKNLISVDGICELFSENLSSAVDKTDNLYSQIIIAFETAVAEGMEPADALSAILDWVSAELKRIQLSQKR